MNPSRELVELLDLTDFRSQAAVQCPAFLAVEVGRMFLGAKRRRQGLLAGKPVAVISRRCLPIVRS